MSKLPRSEMLLVLACAGGAALLAASQFTSMFELTPPGGEAIATVDAADQHGYATLVLACFALVMLLVGIAARSEAVANVAAFSVAACGAVALLIFLVGDLPDANKIGTLDDARQSFIDAKAEPVAGFWFELVGALVLAISGAALATLGPDAAPRQRPARRPARSRRDAEKSKASADNGDRDDDSARSGFQWPSRSKNRKS